MRRACLALALAIWTVGCSTPSPPPTSWRTLPAASIERTIILISFDGFRWDYLDRHPTPEIQRLVARGARAEALIPPFPTKTFPSHYTTVTGLYPEHHGIVANTMVDPELGARFSLADRAAVEDERWWGGEPIWVTGERQGHVTASLFWPGSEGPVQGVRPRHWSRYDASMTHDVVITRVLEWLDQPEPERPSIITVYFSDTDDAGHGEGPSGASVGEAVRRLDRALALLRNGLEHRRLAHRVNLVLTSDHGMTEVADDRVIFLDDYIDVDAVDIVDWWPVLMMSAKSGDHAALVRRLSGAHPELAVYPRHEVPERLHFRASSRITPIVGIAGEGWTVTTRARWAADQASGRSRSKGAHGYDNALPSMHGIFVAAGPAFRRGVVLPPVESVHVYELLCRVLGLTPAPNDGDPAVLAPMLAE